MSGLLTTKDGVWVGVVDMRGKKTNQTDRPHAEMVFGERNFVDIPNREFGFAWVEKEWGKRVYKWASEL